MPDFRVYCTPASATPSEIALSPEESHHLIVVNRARLGDLVVAFDGRGTEWTCELVGDRKAAALLKVGAQHTRKPLPHRITLAQALPKGPAMDAIVRKATEIGAARIVPLESERTQVHLEGERSDRKLEKWHTAALEAAKQCGNPFLPEIAPLQTATAFMASVGGGGAGGGNSGAGGGDDGGVGCRCDLKLIASLAPGARSLKTALAEYRAQHQRAPQTAAWLIGPEGDFSPSELEAAEAHGWIPITLGPLVLRSETAATYALSILSYELQNS
ncbi:MAG: RsmE family RNA methyltransferase [Verrucomicrobiota bacterium]